MALFAVGGPCDYMNRDAAKNPPCQAVVHVIMGMEHAAKHPLVKRVLSGWSGRSSP